MKFDKTLVFRVQGVRTSLAAAILLGILAAVLIIVQAFFLSRIISGVFLGGQAVQQVWGDLLVLLGVIAVRGMLAWGSEVTASRVGTRKNGTARAARGPPVPTRTGVCQGRTQRRTCQCSLRGG